MPELPEVETTRQGILPYTQDQIIKHIVVRTPRLRWVISKTLSEIKNERIIKVSRRAKYLIFHLELGYIIVHLGMSGSLRLVSEDDTVDKHDHVDMVLSNGKILRYNDPRKFGAWLWTESLEDFSLFEKLGPEPLSSLFTGEYLFKVSRNRKTKVKSWLMNNEIVVGVGNIYANEVLFDCRIHPNLAVNELTQEQCHLLAESIKRILQQAIQQGGTTLQDFMQPDGRPGYFKQALNVYGRKNEPCIRCGHPIETVVIGQRSSFYCPICQAIKNKGFD
ncbi:bifunctional DNA-formamidopyrimidine glycosylase/DNA-(apurinic or apyrimidinic site) lyase [Gallibacterium salpingitidis]|uniref:Formamidopyrimidine-DNA glycosylase n=1 Tax=Gallibacterium salpingitidis TaxID=505341 RepID=A0A1A7NX79_9PAST|nr:bifunctional DNA-formamidopyrimidine glycosylase/DNA-(apurinic or apyrimidinic site) lyase [Gallibacterium salpingitidis]OBW94303.1 formamidopyrimidine-DNA glycosylase [Gallibacterium salpingitidis]